MKNRIREYREKAGWSQSELAARVNLSTDAISKIERGARGLRDVYIDRFCRVFCITPGELFDQTAHYLTAFYEPADERNVYNSMPSAPSKPARKKRSSQSKPESDGTSYESLTAEETEKLILSLQAQLNRLRNNPDGKK